MTNGEKIEEIFPNLEISPDPYSPSVDINVGGIMMMRVDRNWWDAEYKEPFINKSCISSGVCEHDKQIVLDKIRAEIAEYGSIMVSYTITNDTKTDKGIEKLLKGVLKQAKEQVLEILDKYRAERGDTWEQYSIIFSVSS